MQFAMQMLAYFAWGRRKGNTEALFCGNSQILYPTLFLHLQREDSVLYHHSTVCNNFASTQYRQMSDLTWTLLHKHNGLLFN